MSSSCTSGKSARRLPWTHRCWPTNLNKYIVVGRSRHCIRSLLTIMARELFRGGGGRNQTLLSISQPHGSQRACPKRLAERVENISNRLKLQIIYKSEISSRFTFLEVVHDETLNLNVSFQLSYVGQLFRGLTLYDSTSPWYL